MVNYEAVLEFLTETIRDVGDIVVEGLGKSLDVEYKSHDHDPVTQIDRAAERVLVEAIRGAYPEHGILTEEGTNKEAPSSSYRWVIDPLDGTTNYLSAYPHFAVSVALEHCGQSDVGCIYDPVRDELFAAIRGKGVWINENEIRVSDQQTVTGATIGIGLSTWSDRAMWMYEQLPEFIERTRAIRIGGSAALDLAYVASGRLDGTWFASLSEWDVAAGILIIEQAGGNVTSLDGEDLTDPEDGILVSNGNLHQEMIEMLCSS